jgi:hypothetical protein
MSRFTVVASLFLASAGCTVDAPHFHQPFDAGAPDAEVPPDAMHCAPNTIDCDDSTGHYVDCGSDGTP